MTSGLLLDENLPPQLAEILEHPTLKVVHVGDEGFLARDDRDIWRFALRANLVVVTKDSDYLDLATVSATGRVILLAVGNMKLKALCEFIDHHSCMIHEFVACDDRILILRRETGG